MGISRSLYGWALPGSLWGWALQRVSGVGHQESLGWALQGVPKLGTLQEDLARLQTLGALQGLGVSGVGHFREALGLLWSLWVGHSRQSVVS